MDGRSYQVYWEHNVPVKLRWVPEDGETKRVGTKCIIKEATGQKDQPIVATGIAWVNPIDGYNKSIGRVIALKRALTEAKIHRTQWSCFFGELAAERAATRARRTDNWTILNFINRKQNRALKKDFLRRVAAYAITPDTFPELVLTENYPEPAAETEQPPQSKAAK